MALLELHCYPGASWKIAPVEPIAMAIAYRIDHDHRLVLVRAGGTLTETDLFSYQREVWSRPEVAGYNELIDMTQVTGIELPTVEQMRKLAALSSSMDDHARASRFAIFAPSDLAFGAGRMYEALRELQSESTKRVGVFRTLAQALAFLGIDSPPTFPDPPPEHGA
jgi:hypothetical protein